MTAIPTPPVTGETVELPTRPTIVLHRSVLLATDASPAAVAAPRVAAALASRWRVTPNVCTVVPPPPVAIDPAGAAIVYSPALAEELRREVARQLESSAPAAVRWPREVGVGAPAAEIVRIAAARGSDLIVLGLRPHAFLDRVFRDETALTVMRQATVPVLAVTPFMKPVARRIAVAIDFSRASIAAARAALALLDDGGSLMLAYVEPPSEPRPADAEGFTAIYAQGVAAAFTRLRQELTARANVRIESVVLHGGGVAPALLSFARRAEIDLLAVGSQRHSIARRAVVGSVTTALARAATCSLLVIPPGRRA
jgi:nucleotide-binding universal stress UspA family protein